MTGVVICTGTDPRPLHDAWASRVLTDIENESLRDTLLASDRFGDRIVNSLLHKSFPDFDPEIPSLANLPTVVAILDLMARGLETRLGLLWLAPRLAAQLMKAEDRIRFGLTDRTQLRNIFRYKDHCTPDLISPITEQPDFECEGAACLIAWLEAQSTHAAQRLRITMTPNIYFQPETREARAALVNAALSDPLLMEPEQ